MKAIKRVGMFVETKQFHFLKNGLFIGAGIGLAAGISSTIWAKNRQTLHPDAILDRIKQAFTEEGKIEGAWIVFDEQPVHKFAVHTTAYSGGITRIEDGSLVMYEFLADAKTGTVLDIERTDVV